MAITTKQLFKAMKAIVRNDIHGLTCRQIGVLLTLVHWPAKQPSPSTKDLADDLGINKPSISRALTKLEELGLISNTHAQNDRRMRIVAITPAGSEYMENVQKEPAAA